MNKNILLIHGSSDLYGASRVFISIAQNIISLGFVPIVLLPYKETLDIELSSMGIEVFISPIAVLRRQNNNLIGWLAFSIDLLKSIIFIKKLNRQYAFDLVYTNTSAVLSGAIYSRLFHKKHIWHVHEIITKPALIKHVIPKLIDACADIVIANSQATLNFLTGKGVKSNKTRTVYNGIVSSQVNSTPEIRGQNSKVLIGTIGRFNRWKGQEILLKAARKTSDLNYDFNFVLIGSYFRNEAAYLGRIKQMISDLGLTDSVEVKGFINNIEELYNSLDIVVVPSTEPEPFGLVAIEAMSMKKSVIASNIGALPEIVVDGETGILFEPGNDETLKEAIVKLAQTPELRAKMGEAGYRRQQLLFSKDTFDSTIKKIILEV